MQAIRGRILHFVGKALPVGVTQPPAHQYFADGILVIGADGKVIEVGEANDVKPRLPEGTPIKRHEHHLIMPGFIDCHVHYPQLDNKASYGEALLKWLENYTFPAERRFVDPAYSQRIAKFFLDQCLACGTTTALVFATVHKCSADKLFEECFKRNMRMITGKVLMDDAPGSGLNETDGTLGYDDSKELIEKWHGKGRLNYAVTPRFAVSSTSAQLTIAGRLLSEYPTTYLHTHLSENVEECALVQKRFPTSKDYLDVYQQHGLVTDRAVFAHSIHLDDDAFARLAKADSACAWCALSNMFLGSGFFKYDKAISHGVRVGLGTDVGAGNDLSIVRAGESSYKSQRLAGSSVDPLSLMYLMTLGGARALKLDDKIGSFEPGKEADFVVLNLCATPMLGHRVDVALETEKEKLNTAKSSQEMQKIIHSCLNDIIFAVTMLGPSTLVEETYVMGKCEYSHSFDAPRRVPTAKI